MQIFELLDELRTMACNGLTYATNPYDRERYERLLQLTSQSYAEILDLPSEQIREQLRAEIGYITPKVGADAAIFDDEGRILLHLRADDGCWCLPCGWVNANESPLEAAVREVYEETGLHVRPLELVDIFTRKPGRYGNLYTMIAILYLCEVIGGELTLSHEGLALRYWTINEVTDWHANHEEYARAAHIRWQTRLMSALADCPSPHLIDRPCQ
ncbi:MAG: NUDIX hydrolase N-terminal domain-containing protein [Caldilineaceae bacterium]|nr:NUDIX hydrolase N-terminal domain-containing protein [Caldilineaceae bacterium]